MSAQVRTIDPIAAHFDVAATWDLTFLETYLQENGFPATTRADGLAEYRRFIAMTRCSGAPCVPSRVIDQIWHAHILHSKDYVAFSRALGIDYIHHFPAKDGEKEALRQEYNETLERYRSIFAGEPNPSIWHIQGEADCGDNDPGSDCRGTCDHNVPVS